MAVPCGLSAPALESTGKGPVPTGLQPSGRKHLTHLVVGGGGTPSDTQGTRSGSDRRASEELEASPALCPAHRAWGPRGTHAHLGRGEKQAGPAGRRLGRFLGLPLSVQEKGRKKEMSLPLTPSLQEAPGSDS